MIEEAILSKIYHLGPNQILVAMLIVFALTGLLASVLPMVLFEILERTPKAKAKNRRNLNVELLRKYESLCAEHRDLHERYEGLARENQRLVGLVREEVNHNLDWDRRSRREVKA